MISRFDHAVIAVRDLTDGMRRFESLGFTVSRGGRHPGQGTENAIVRFGLDYLELLAVTDEHEAQPTGLGGLMVNRFLKAFRRGLIGYALASDGIAQDADRLRAFGLEVEGPFSMRRERPDGSTLAWQLAIPGGSPWRRPWPFLIAWETPDAERLSREQPSAHANGACGVLALTVAVNDLASTTRLYRDGFGLTLVERFSHPDMDAEGARLSVGTTHLDLLTPHDAEGDSMLARSLRLSGEGPFSITLGTSDNDATHRAIAAQGASVMPNASHADDLVLDTGAVSGARLLIHPQDS